MEAPFPGDPKLDPEEEDMTPTQVVRRNLAKKGKSFLKLVPKKRPSHFYSTKGGKPRVRPYDTAPEAEEAQETVDQEHEQETVDQKKQKGTAKAQAKAQRDKNPYGI